MRRNARTGMSDRAIFTLRVSTFSFNNRLELLLRLSELELPVCCFKLSFEMVSLITDGRKSKLRPWTFVL